MRGAVAEGNLPGFLAEGFEVLRLALSVSPQILAQSKPVCDAGLPVGLAARRTHPSLSLLPGWTTPVAQSPSLNKGS
jgi:hypothetical protein